MCRQTLALLPRLASADPSPPERARALEHLRGCALCRRAWRRYDPVLAVEAFALAAPPPEGLALAVLSRAEAGETPSRPWPLRSALIIALVVWLAVAWWRGYFLHLAWSLVTAWIQALAVAAMAAGHMERMLAEAAPVLLPAAGLLLLGEWTMLRRLNRGGV